MSIDKDLVYSLRKLFEEDFKQSFNEPVNAPINDDEDDEEIISSDEDIKTEEDKDLQKLQNIVDDGEENEYIGSTQNGDHIYLKKQKEHVTIVDATGKVLKEEDNISDLKDFLAKNTTELKISKLDPAFFSKYVLEPAEKKKEEELAQSAPETNATAIAPEEVDMRTPEEKAIDDLKPITKEVGEVEDTKTDDNTDEEDKDDEDDEEVISDSKLEAILREKYLKESPEDFENRPEYDFFVYYISKYGQPATKSFTTRIEAEQFVKDNNLSVDSIKAFKMR